MARRRDESVYPPGYIPPELMWLYPFEPEEDEDEEVAGDSGSLLAEALRWAQPAGLLGLTHSAGPLPSLSPGVGPSIPSGGTAPSVPSAQAIARLAGGQGLPQGGGIGQSISTRGRRLPDPGNFDRWGTAFQNASVPIGQAENYFTEIRQPGGATVYMRPDVAANFLLMQNAAERAGVPLVAREGYRDWNAQAAADARHGPGLAAPAGSSNHGMGVAIDFSQYDHDWLARNADRFGFYQPMDWEPWHWQPFTAESGGYTEDESIPTLYSKPARRWYSRHGLAFEPTPSAPAAPRRRREVGYSGQMFA